MNKAPENYKIAVAGAGLIGQRHARLVANTCLLSAIIDPLPNAKLIAEDLKTQWFESLDDFLSSDVGCDGIIIATPNHLHAPMTDTCLINGIPCLIEKPLASSSKEATDVYKTQQETGIPVLVGHHRRHHIRSTTTKNMLEAGEIGTLVSAQVTWMLRKPDEYFEKGDWRKTTSGGPVWINLIHEIDLLRYMIGEIEDVSAMTSNAIRQASVEETAAILLRFSNNVLATAIVSDATPSPWHFEGGSGENPTIAATGHDGMRLFGTHASMEFPSQRIWKHADPSGHWGTEIFSHNGPDDQDAMKGESALRAQLLHFIDVISGKADPIVSALDGLKNILVAEAILEAARSGQQQTIPQSGDIIS